MADDDSLAGELDRLYGLPLAEFTPARNALARRLRADSRPEKAAEVAALRKPVLAAWVVNRLARERRDDVRALIDAAAAVREGTSEGEERFRAVNDDLLRAARGLLEREGGRATDAVVRDIASTLRAAAATDPDLLTSGRLTTPLEPTGFEAMAGASPRKVARPTGKRRVDRNARRKRVADAREALAAARDEARRLTREADAAERAARRLRADADSAERRVAEAEARLARIQDAE